MRSLNNFLKFTQVLTRIKLGPDAMVPEMFILYHRDSSLVNTDIY